MMDHTKDRTSNCGNAFICEVSYLNVHCLINQSRAQLPLQTHGVTVLQEPDATSLRPHHHLPPCLKKHNSSRTNTQRDTATGVFNNHDRGCHFLRLGPARLNRSTAPARFNSSTA